MSDILIPLSLVDLPRTVGSTLQRHVDWTVPADFSTETMGLEEDSEVGCDVDLTSIDEGVLVTVNTEVDLVGECVRCLDPVRVHHHVTSSEVYSELPDRAGKHDKASKGDELDDIDDEKFRIDRRDTIDLEPLLRDAVLFLADERPLCTPDCPGLCPVCGGHLRDLPPDHHHDVIDPRFEVLASFFDAKDKNSEDTEQ